MSEGVLCILCGPISCNQADFEVFYGSRDDLLRVCRWCGQDLELLGFRSNQVIRLSRGAIPSISLLEIFGPVYSFVSGWKVSEAASLFVAKPLGLAHAEPRKIFAQCAGAASPIHEPFTIHQEARA
ncbi:MAG TPA: hypothetical protein VI864_02755 [Candidatus Bathyarchaeia archaeon]|nr:hypothetical protein [Candidatus Bathyarchaeia archaeon]